MEKTKFDPQLNVEKSRFGDQNILIVVFILVVCGELHGTIFV